MGNLGFRKFGVMALCCAIATTSIPRFAPGMTELTEAAQSVLDWQDRLAQMEQAKTDPQPFVSLHYDEQQGVLYRDGKPVGDHCGEYAVVNGKLMLSAEAAGCSETEGEYVSLEKAAATMGCQVTEDENGVTVTSPFDSACLIVKSTSAVDPMGAIDCVTGYGDLYVLQYATPADAYAAYLCYIEDDAVEYAEPSRTVSVAATEASAQAYSYTTDENADWGLFAIGADTYNTWLTASYETLPEVTVAVIDTGIYAEHERFAGRLAGNGAAFLDENNYSVDDGHGHGTHCAGIIAAATTDNVKILPVRSLDAYGYGSILGIYCGMIYALEQGVDVVSMSLGIDAESPLVLDAARQLSEADILCCVASGNESMPAEYISPARSEHCITVGALDSALEIAYFSNYGAELDFAAPGVDVLSAGIETPDDYVTMSGTSMATPYVAAACAMVLSGDADLTNEQVYDYLKANADDLGEPGRDDYFGYGMIQMADFRFSAERCEPPYADLESGSYAGAQTVTLSCDTEGAAIYYTLDGSVPTAANGTLYEGPITISESSVLSAVACSETATSSVLVMRYIINGKDVNNALVIENGVLVAYQGVLTELDLTAETFTAVGDNAFMRNTQLEEVLLPETVTGIGNSAFEGCTALWNFEAPGVVSVGDRAFYGDAALNWCDTAPLTSVGVSAFENCSDLYRCYLSAELTEIPDRLFKGAYYSDSLDLPNVTVIGDRAFEQCYFIGLEDLNWSGLTEIGAYAFAECELSGYEISLDSLVSIGKGAFEATGISALTLSENITVIPENLLFDASLLTYFCAPGVTEVEAYGLATGADSYNVHTQTVMNFGNITKVGEAAFLGYYFDTYTEFTALTDVSSYAFALTGGDVLSFPALTVIPTETFLMCRNAALCFENASAVEFRAFYDIQYPIVLTETCTEFDTTSFAGNCALVAAPENSPAEKYALEEGIPFQATPSIYSQATEYTFTVMDDTLISAVGLGFDLSYQWYDVNGDAIEGETTPYYRPVLADGETAVYTLTLFDAAGEQVDTMDFTVTMEPVVLSGTLTTDAPTIIDHKSLQAEYKATVEDSWEDFTLNRHYSFTPEADGTYYFYAAVDRADTVMKLHSVTFTEYYGGSYNFISADLTAGEEYLLTISFTDDDFAGALGVTTEHPDSVYEDLYYSYWEESSYETVVPESFPYEPHPTLLNYSDEALIEGVDYQLIYVNNEGAGTMYIYAIGMGDYIGRSDAMTLYLTQRLVLDEPVLIETSSSTDEIKLTFTPEVSGEYHLYTAYPLQLLTGEEGYSLRDIADSDPVISVYDSKGTVDEYCDDYDGYYSSTLLSALTLTLKAGVEYTVECDSYGASTYEIVITQTMNNLMDCMLSISDELMEQSQVEEAVSVIDADGNALTLNVDYALYTEMNNGAMTIVADGIGSYFGSLENTYYSGDTPEEGTVPENYAVITPNVDFTLDPAVEAYYVEITESGNYGFVSDSTETVYDDIMFYSYDAASDSMSYYDYIFSTYTVWLDEGAYFVFIPESYGEVSDTYCLMEKISIADAEITIEDLYYNGAEQYPTVTVTLDGETLIENVDYLLSGEMGAVQCGSYTVFVEGIGKYYNSVEAYYRILPVLDSISGTLTDGMNTVSVTEAGTSQVYQWIPARTDLYCFASLVIEDVTIAVMDENGDTYCEVRGYDEAYDFGRFVAGQTYYVMVQYAATDMTGDIAFMIGTGMTALSDCEIVIEQPNYYTGELLCPAVSVYDGETLLTEGVDYQLIRYAANREIGEGIVCLKGMGSYVGRADGVFSVYYTALDAEIMENAQPLSPSLNESDPLMFETPYSYFAYSFTNDSPDTVRYCVELYDYDSVCVIQAYDATGAPIVDFDPAHFTLAGGETIYLMAIAHGVNWYLGCEASFIVQEVNTWEYVADGVVYLIDGDTATVIGVTGDRFGYNIPSRIYDESFDMGYVDVTDADNELYYSLAWHTQIFYVETWTTAAQTLDAFGLVVVCLDDVSDAAGDVDGNGYCDIDDVVILSAWIAEAEGVQIAVGNMPNADVNNDGIYDFADVGMISDILYGIV